MKDHLIVLLCIVSMGITAVPERVDYRDDTHHVLVKDQDPDVYALFLKIKNDYGIREDIPLYLMQHGVNYYNRNTKSRAALTTKYLSTNPHVTNNFPEIFISSDYTKWDKSYVRYVLAHELEHVRQGLKYVGSYHGTHRACEEQAADAAAYDYIGDCPECLQEQIPRCRRVYKYNLVETEHGVLTTSEGYFAAEDVDLWIQRCQDEKSLLCLDHEKQFKDTLRGIVKFTGSLLLSGIILYRLDPDGFKEGLFRL